MAVAITPIVVIATQTRSRDKAGQSATHIRSSVCASLCRYQMSDRRRAFRLETMHLVLQYPIDIEPGLDAECLDKDTLF